LGPRSTREIGREGYRPVETIILVKATEPDAICAVPATALDKIICGCKTAPYKQ